MLSRSSILIPYNGDFIPNATSKDCLFEVLRESLDSRYKIPEFVTNSIHFDEVKSQFYKKVNEIKECQSIPPKDEEDEDYYGEPLRFDRKVVVKRKRVEDKNWKTKRTKLSENTFHKSLLNQLLIEDEYKRFHEMFEKLQFIEIQNDDDEENTDEDIKIVFDLYPENKINNFKPKKPTCRITIVKVNEPFPNAGQIRKACKKQKYPVPVLVVAINENSQISGFLYYFS